MRVALVRHGRTRLNAQGRFQAQSDAPLDAVGVLQAQRAAKALTPGRWSAVYSSPMARAVETARAFSRHLDVAHLRVDELRERNLGTVDGLDRAEFSRRCPDAMRSLRADPGFAPPGGESGHIALARFCRGLGRVAAAEHGSPSLVVTHGGVLHLLVRALLGREAGETGMVGTCRAVCLDVEGTPEGGMVAALLQWDVEPLSCEDHAADRPARTPTHLNPKGNAFA
ncbi:histidine phosphatase family protein [Nocardiopsis tropica]|uniref:Histidine phosphatase family protein n=1 Tax=Nocardiopsis tropica TaxID=109330 RepID=A0ABU7KIP2_9ACTN|nr:histidine phosphatase family protein [Nocardiopsis umidischolae]MEE2049178.1 histidine phosphatase family protein [Nocardiopsis umidischolae]